MFDDSVYIIKNICKKNCFWQLWYLFTLYNSYGENHSHRKNFAVCNIIIFWQSRNYFLNVLYQKIWWGPKQLNSICIVICLLLARQQQKLCPRDHRAVAARTVCCECSPPPTVPLLMPVPMINRPLLLQVTDPTSHFLANEIYHYPTFVIIF